MQREEYNSFFYQVPKTGEDVDPITVKAFDIRQTKSNCIMKTVFEYYNPSKYYNEYDGSYYGDW
jgi:hypothetical protein